jgi:hypothetical protein
MSCLDGKGTGVWNKLSVNLPIAIKASLERKEVRQFAENIVSKHLPHDDITS